MVDKLNAPKRVDIQEELDYYPWPLASSPAGSAIWLAGAGHYRNGHGCCQRAGLYEVACLHFILRGKGIYSVCGKKAV